MMGKRVNYAARSVISPDPNINMDDQWYDSPVHVLNKHCFFSTLPNCYSPWFSHKWATYCTFVHVHCILHMLCQSLYALLCLFIDKSFLSYLYNVHVHTHMYSIRIMLYMYICMSCNYIQMHIILTGFCNSFDIP